jgi:hypothetical protein
MHLSIGLYYNNKYDYVSQATKEGIWKNTMKYSKKPNYLKI